MASPRPDWVQDAIFYQIFAERFDNGDPTNDPPGVEPWGSAPTRENFFGGDLTGIRRRLPYLSDLGINAIYLTPIFLAGTNHRYDAHDYRLIDPVLGDIHNLRSLVRDAHALGIRVVLDGVFNHCGDGFWAFRDLQARGADSPYRDWFFPRQFPIRQDQPTYQTCGGAPYLPKLNTDNPDLRRYLIETATYWIEEADIDGWRLDVPWKAPHDFWEEFQSAVKAVKPDAYLVGEIWRDARSWLDVFDGVMNYRLRDALLDFCVRDHMDAEDVAYEIEFLQGGFAETAAWQLNLLGSHDTARLLTMCGGDTRRAILALTALFTLIGSPLLYYGDENGMEGENDPDCRRCMEWDQTEWQSSIATASRRLITIRRSSVALRRGSWQRLLVFNGVLAFRRVYEQDHVVVVLNPRDEQREFAIPIPDAPATRWRDLLGGARYEVVDGQVRLAQLDASSALILVPDSGV